MTGSDPQFWKIFFEVYEALPRQGPGNRTSAERALALCRDLPPGPAVADLGCGVGGQTLYLAELTAGRIDAIDSHAPSITRLTKTVADRGLAGRIRPRVSDMANPGLPAGSYDLVWSEGALSTSASRTLSGSPHVAAPIGPPGIHGRRVEGKGPSTRV